MRTNLITHFHCSKCGHQLKVEYPTNESPRLVDDREQTTQEPTGAACMYNKIIVEPCKKCIEKETGPAVALASAIREIVGE